MGSGLKNLNDEQWEQVGQGALAARPNEPLVQIGSIATLILLGGVFLAPQLGVQINEDFSIQL